MLLVVRTFPLRSEGHVLNVSFADVVNGEANRVWVSIENKSDKNITLTSIAGSFHDPDSNKVLKNVRISSGPPPNLLKTFTHATGL